MPEVLYVAGTVSLNFTEAVGPVPEIAVVECVPLKSVFEVSASWPVVGESVTAVSGETVICASFDA